MTTTPPGWYDDAHGSVRWWDGERWTEHVHAPDAAASAPAQKPASKLWILWVVIGVVVLGFIVVAVTVIPLVIGLLAGGGADSDQDAAVAAVQGYDDAWQTADCDEFFAVTSADFRTSNELADCETFEATSENFQDSVIDYTVAVDDVTTDGDTITVDTTETYTDAADEEAGPGSYAYRYVLVQDGDAWVIDGLQ